MYAEARPKNRSWRKTQCKTWQNTLKRVRRRTGTCRGGAGRAGMRLCHKWERVGREEESSFLSATTFVGGGAARDKEWSDKSFASSVLDRSWIAAAVFSVPPELTAPRFSMPWSGSSLSTTPVTPPVELPDLVATYNASGCGQQRPQTSKMRTRYRSIAANRLLVTQFICTWHLYMACL